MTDLHCKTCHVVPPPGSTAGGVCAACGGTLGLVEGSGAPSGPPGISLPAAAEGDAEQFVRAIPDDQIPQRRPLSRPPAIAGDGLIPQAPNVEPLELDPEWVAKRSSPARRVVPPPAPPGSVWKVLAIAIVLATGGIAAYVLLHHHRA